MALPQHFMDELRRRSSLSQIVGKHVKLTKRGGRHLGLCPFHNEKSPSFNVRDDEGFYHCFGCGASGDAISFLREKEGLGFMDAVRSLADAAGMTVPAQTPQDPAEVERRNKTMVVLDEGARQFQSALMRGNNPAQAYLEKRGLNQDAIETFRLGFAPRSGLIDAMARLGHDKDALIEAGLARVSDRDQSLYEMFRHRLMFPITDNRGQVIAFGARALDDDQQPKYLNSAETKTFQKKHVLYGMALARVAVRQGKPLVVAEGYMDVIAIHQSAVAAAVAPLGTALTEEQIKLLWRMDDRPILCFDGDTAGKSAALKALIRSIPLLEPGKTLRLALMPAGVDPDDLIKSEGADAFSRLLDQSISWVDGLWDGVSAQFQLNDAAERAAFWAQIRSHVKEINNGQMRASIGDEIERRISDMRATMRDAGRSSSKWGRGFTPLKASDRPSIQDDFRARVILALLVEHPDLINDFYEQIGLLQFRDEKMEKLRQTVISIMSDNSNLDDDGLDVEGFRLHLSEYGFEKIRGMSLLRGMEARIRFDPASLNRSEAREKLAEVIGLEITGNRRSNKKVDLQRLR